MFAITRSTSKLNVTLARGGSVVRNERGGGGNEEVDAAVSGTTSLSTRAGSVSDTVVIPTKWGAVTIVKVLGMVAESGSVGKFSVSGTGDGGGDSELKVGGIWGAGGVADGEKINEPIFTRK